uniref:MADF domain-containing protein n=1 Tax=Glossina morsitans morsitans TaxID=37546 RepID=A0A1B0GD25_GLOMM
MLAKNSVIAYHDTMTKEQFLFTLDLLAVVRRNASDKLKLIQMVHDNPILWDSRLPNFKGAEEEKNRAWEMIGKKCNAPGKRVARAFKSLRESYRRELAHVKLMGNGFKPKWSLYEAMDFLRDVIRERKGGSHAVEHNVPPLGLNLSAFAQHMNSASSYSSSSNNNNNNNSNNNANSNNSNRTNFKLNSTLQNSFSDAALNLSKCSSALNMSGNGGASGGSGGSDYYYNFLKSELDLSQQQLQNHHQQQQQQQQHNGTTTTANGTGGVTPSSGNLHIPPAHQNSHNDSRVSSTRNDTTHHTTYDDIENSSMRSGDEEASSLRNAASSNQESDEVEELEAIDADFPYPLILNSNSPSSNVGGQTTNHNNNKRRRKHLQSGGVEDSDIDDDDDDYEGQMMQQHRHLRAQNVANLDANGMVTGMDILPPQQTVREVLNSKFCGFISAKLNSMEDTEADNLMNKILMLLVQTQTNSGDVK